MTSGQLNGYLANIDEQAQDLFSWLIKQMAVREGIAENLKLENPMKWIGRMNNIRNRAKEIVDDEIICR